MEQTRRQGNHQNELRAASERKDQEIEFYKAEAKKTDELRQIAKRRDQEVDELRAKLKSRDNEIAS